MDLNDPLLIAAIAAVVVVLALIVLLVSRSRRHKRTRRLRERFGPEYTRTVDRRGSRAKAEDELEERERRRDRLRLVDLDAEQRRSLHLRWDELQTSFVDGPESAVRGAEVLIDDASRARGYPDADREQRLLDLGVDHSDEVHRYREASAEVHDKKGTDVEARRRQLLAARGLFEALVGPAPSDAALAHEAPRREEPVVEAPFERVLTDDSTHATAAEPATREPTPRDVAAHEATPRDARAADTTRDAAPRDAAVTRDATTREATTREATTREATTRDPGAGDVTTPGAVPAVAARDPEPGVPPSDQVLDGVPEPGLAERPPRSDEHTVAPPPPPPPTPDDPDAPTRR